MIEREHDNDRTDVISAVEIRHDAEFIMIIFIIQLFSALIQ